MQLITLNERPLPANYPNTASGQRNAHQDAQALSQYGTPYGVVHDTQTDILFVSPIWAKPDTFKQQPPAHTEEVRTVRFLQFLNSGNITDAKQLFESLEPDTDQTALDAQLAHSILEEKVRSGQLVIQQVYTG